MTIKYINICIDRLVTQLLYVMTAGQKSLTNHLTAVQTFMHVYSLSMSHVGKNICVCHIFIFISSFTVKDPSERFQLLVVEINE